jgi:hypothetical protein
MGFDPCVPQLFVLFLINCTRRMLRYAPRFHRKNLEKNRQKKFNQKKIHKKIRKFSVNFFVNFFWLSRFHIKFGACLRKFGESRPAGLGGDRERTDST